MPVSARLRKLTIITTWITRFSRENRTYWSRGGSCQPASTKRGVRRAVFATGGGVCTPVSGVIALAPKVLSVPRVRQHPSFLVHVAVCARAEAGTLLEATTACERRRTQMFRPGARSFPRTSRTGTDIFRDHGELHG